jgi:hypothetical protein
MLKKLLSLLGLGRKRATLVVTVPPGRRGGGSLRAIDAQGKDLLGGSLSVAARADEALARGHGNPARDVMRPYGDPACGTYLMIAIDRLAGASESVRDEIGECQLLFEPSEGDAARAESGGRLLLALHGGRMGADNRLRATAGGLRVRDRDLETLVGVLASEEEWRLELREEAPKMLPPDLSTEPAGAGIDPPVPFSAEAQRAIERRSGPPASDDSWRDRHDDDWRSSRDTYSSSGPAVAAVTGAAVGAAAAQAGKVTEPPMPPAEPESGADASQEGSSDTSSGTSY